MENSILKNVFLIFFFFFFYDVNVSCVFVCPHSAVCELAVLIDPRRFVRQGGKRKKTKSCHRFISLISLSHVAALLLFLPGRAVGVLSLREHAPTDTKSIRFLSFLLIYSSKNILSLNLGLHIIIILVPNPPNHPFCCLSRRRKKQTKTIVCDERLRLYSCTCHHFV